MEDTRVVINLLFEDALDPEKTTHPDDTYTVVLERLLRAPIDGQHQLLLQSFADALTRLPNDRKLVRGDHAREQRRFERRSSYWYKILMLMFGHCDMDAVSHILHSHRLPAYVRSALPLFYVRQGYAAKRLSRPQLRMLAEKFDGAMLLLTNISRKEAVEHFVTVAIVWDRLLIPVPAGLYLGSETSVFRP